MIVMNCFPILYHYCLKKENLQLFPVSGWGVECILCAQQTLSAIVFRYLS
jgi:hypothetical protein